MSVRHIYASLVVPIVVLGLLSCVHRSSTSTDLKQGTRPLENIRIADLGGKLRVEVDWDRGLTYSLSTGVAPTSVTIDLHGLSKGKGLQPIELNKPPVLRVIPTEVSKPRPAVQLVFTLTSAVTPEVRKEDTRLVIDFPKVKTPVEAAAAAPAETSESPALSAQEQPAVEPNNTEATPALAASASTMTKVEVKRGEAEATVVIHGDGEFRYDVRRLSQNRLIVDLANVSTPLRIPVLPVDHPLLKQIRVGHHSNKTRLVLDLPKPSSYLVQPGSHSLAIRLTALGQAADPDIAAKGSDAEGGEQDDKRARFATAGRVPFPERLALIEESARFAQMAPEAKGTAEPDETAPQRYVGRRISLDFQQADITNVLRLIADVSGFNIVVGEGVKAKVTMKLVSVPWDQALDMLLKMNGLGMIREGTIVWIDTLANIAKQQDEETRAKESKSKAEDLLTDVIYVHNVTAQEIQTTLRQYLSPRGQLQINQASNALVLQDTESRMLAFKKLVRDLDQEVPLVQIEARIVQADTNYARSLGIQWGFANLTSLSGQRVFNFRGQGGSLTGIADAFGAQTSQFLVNLPAAVGGLISPPAAGLTYGRVDGGGALLDVRISAGEQLGLTKVIAAPKITTLDKREAKIEQGEAIPFQTTSLQGTQTTFVDANLTLQVTPQITSRDPGEEGKRVLLKIRATRNAVGARSTPAGPSIEKREATTQVLVRDGETMVIGGIFVDEQSNTVTGVPWLSRIPVLGWLFKGKTETIAKQELLIFLTPTIVKS